MRSFRSDNNAGLCPEALDAIVRANDDDHYLGYGDDTWTGRAVERFRAIFGPRTHVSLVATGTAANVLAIAAMTERWEHVVCHRHSHYAADESTAPERITGCRTMAVESDSSKITVDDLAGVAANRRGDVHESQPGVVTLSNPTEFGTLYRPDEVAALCSAAHAAGYRVHVDGARFANAVAALGCDPRALSVDAGVDALSFGGTKNGLAAGEAVLLFPQGDGAAFERGRHAIDFLRKGTGHLLSKHRFVAAPFEAVLADGVWLRHAAHANAMAARLAQGLEALGVPLAFPPECNGVFVVLPPEAERALEAAGHGYYLFGDLATRTARLMCSFDTRPADVDTFLAAVRAGRLR